MRISVQLTFLMMMMLDWDQLLISVRQRGNGVTERVSLIESTEGEEKPARSETEVAVSQRTTIPLTLRMRVATAAAVGAAADHAKLLADQEEREVELLVSTLVEAQASLRFCLY